MRETTLIVSLSLLASLVSAGTIQEYFFEQATTSKRNGRIGELACDDLFTAACSQRIQSNPFAKDIKEVSNFNRHPEKWASDYDPEAQKVFAKLVKCLTLNKTDDSKNSTAQGEKYAYHALKYGKSALIPRLTAENAQKVLRDSIVHLCTRAKEELAIYLNCRPSEELSTEDIIRLAILENKIPIFEISQDVLGLDEENNGVYANILYPVLPDISGLLWHANTEDKHFLHIQSVMAAYRNFIVETSGMSGRNVEILIQLQQNLASIQEEPYQKYFKSGKKVSLCADKFGRWPKWVEQMCHKYGETYTYDPNFVLGLEAVLNQTKPNMIVLAAMLTYSQLNPLKERGRQVLQPRRFTAMFENCPSDDEIKAVHNFRYAKALDSAPPSSTFWLSEQKKYATEIAENLKTTLIAQFQFSSLSPKTKRIMQSAVRNLIIQLGVPDHFFEEEYDLSQYTDERNYLDGCRRYTLFSRFSQKNAWALPSCNRVTIYQPNMSPPVLDYFRSLQQYQVYDYAGFGRLVGHEMGHHFDARGLRYLTRNFTEQVLTDVEQQAFFDSVRCFRHDMENTCCHNTGRKRVCTEPLQNQGEDMSDLFGLNLALSAYEANALQKDLNAGMSRGDLDSATGADELRRLFFYTYAALQCAGWEDQDEAFHDVDDVHSPRICRVNTVLRQMRAYKKVFGCDSRFDKMARPDRDICTVW